MLIRFEVANHRSIREAVELSMVAIDHERDAARAAPMIGESLLPVAAIYGPNASGKSNVVSALAWLSSAVRRSVRFWEDEIPVDPFAFGGGPSSSSDFVIEFLVDGVRCEYVVEVDRERIVYEGLFHYPEKKRRRVFERVESELTLQRGLGGLAGVRKLLTDRTLVLAAARRFGEPLVTDFANKLMNIQIFGRLPRHNSRAYQPMRYSFTEALFEQEDQIQLFGDEELDVQFTGSRQQALSLLRLADMGIEDVVIDRVEVVVGTETMERRRVRLLHKTSAESAPLDMSAESEGTRTWFQLIGPVLSALRQGSVVLCDELDASLHPTLSAELLRIFHSPVTNPLGAQLIFTSHDTSLLNHLNRDEVWLTEKRDDGSTRLGGLAEFAGERVRKSQNLENAYLHGRFGALPQVDQADLLRALGLIG
ncbi:ATP-binding protein [Actinocorallia lasiicapitis]